LANAVSQYTATRH